jgi:hypothetical protein
MFFQFCDIATFGDHPQEEFTKFSHEPERKLQNFKKSSYIFVACKNRLFKNVRNLEFFPPNLTTLVHFACKNPLNPVAMDSICHPRHAMEWSQPCPFR